MLKNVKNKQEQSLKPLYKMKMFSNVDSKVKENLKNFKTYDQKKQNDVDNLIEKVEQELKDINQEEQK